MKLLTFLSEGKEKFGIKTEEGIVNLEKALQLHPNSRIPIEMNDIIQEGVTGLSLLGEYLNSLPMDHYYIEDEEEISFGPAITSPNKIICVGLNYRKHADETNSSYPEIPILFNKFTNTLIGHKKNIQLPRVTSKVDYEVELGIVIGSKTKNVTVSEALDHALGYVTANDISARDLQLRTSQWLLGKNCDGFCPLGPYLVSKDEVGNPNDLQLKTTVNGEVRQYSNTSDMIFHCDEIISFVSHHLTLFPGDVILTGTPEGVIMGEPEDRQVYLKSGDEVTVEIEKLGKLTNYFV
ncbi:fumarylacetoacetate hydrolase family protein [Terrihalobacillus insolitus]|uniref:fumarylacetoacetate hydrolase family protein n=1 Tax=Terrihalobacillus insolitus TaxID=2950438 RepID=UPI0023401EBE|nr:fumarylacetoacetate hydrolase family protein [Terrihalobacillus insolitus]MDC3415153.1 fumarylacetoacetate hydrolase family protein [Terrihalobacillus insolitus]